MKRFALLLLALAAVGAAPAQAELVSKGFEYTHGTTPLEGVLVYDSATPGKRPGILLAHELGATNAVTRSKAGQLAQLGYAVLAVDLYGKGMSPKDAARHPLDGKNRSLMRARALTARAAIERIVQVDPKRVAAIGYGVGGVALLDLARAKSDLEGVVCVHGDLTPSGDEGKNVGAAVLVIVGADDPKIPLAQVALFEEEMRRGGVDWQVIRYGGVAGDFTNPQAGRNLKTGRAFDPDADRRSADAIRLFLAEIVPPAIKAGKTLAPKAVPKGVPDKVLKVLEYVDQHAEAIDGYEGGRSFGNFERRLPQTDDKGRRIKYREWDVNPLRPGVNRGPERLITGSDGAAYFTDDHYANFKKVR